MIRVIAIDKHKMDFWVSVPKVYEKDEDTPQMFTS